MVIGDDRGGCPADLLADVGRKSAFIPFPPLEYAALHGEVGFEHSVAGA